MIFGDKISQNGLNNNEKASRVEKNSLEPFSFSALHFLRNRLLPSDISQCYNFASQPNAFQSQTLPPLETILPLSKLSTQAKPSSATDYSSSSSSLLAVKSPNLSPISLNSPVTGNNSQSTLFCSSYMRRPRGEKRPIPEEQKDEKYFERRKRNNEAAKKSRDARKLREDRIALRAAILEQENSILRAQTIALREEVCTLRQILCNSRALTSIAMPSSPQI